MHCEITKTLWKELEHHLTKIFDVPVTEPEKVFGLLGNTPNIILRNWLTFNLRHCVVKQEGPAFHNRKGPANIIDIKIMFNEKIKSELMEKYHIYTNLARLDYFKRIFMVNDYLVTWENNWYQVLTLFSV